MLNYARRAAKDIDPSLNHHRFDMYRNPKIYMDKKKFAILVKCHTQAKNIPSKKKRLIFLR